MMLICYKTCSQGIKAVIAESYERIHRSNLVGMGIIPLQFLEGQNADTLSLTGKEKYTIRLPEDAKPLQQINVQVRDNTLSRTTSCKTIAPSLT